MFNSLDNSKCLFERKGRKNAAENAEKALKSSWVSFAPSANPLRPLRSKKFGLGLLLAVAAVVASAQTRFDGIGRAATPAEVQAWDIDVRPDFKGLPKGQGSVAQGEKLWAAQCSSCHGDFGESNEVFTPIAGGTTAADIQSGRVAALMPGTNTPQRTTLMKLSSLSTLWDYINRAMPWTAPKSLKPDEVYALSAYILNLGNIVPASFVLSDQNIRDVQNKLPNRNGKTTQHAMWPGDSIKGTTSRPDAQGSTCMSNCAADPRVASLLPEHARDAHGNLATQSRTVGGSRGANTLRSSPETVKKDEKVAIAGANTAQSATNSVASLVLTDVNPIMQKSACLACHGLDTKLIGPSFTDIAKKYAAQADGVNYLAGKIQNGSQGVWGQIPMPAQAVSPEEAARVAQWLVQGAKK
jgi:S-disulfanyl-L-cysteine oxidoreductase SoxD